MSIHQDPNGLCVRVLGPLVPQLTANASDELVRVQDLLQDLRVGPNMATEMLRARDRHGRCRATGVHDDHVALGHHILLLRAEDGHELVEEIHVGRTEQARVLGPHMGHELHVDGAEHLDAGGPHVDHLAIGAWPDQMRQAHQAWAVLGAWGGLGRGPRAGVALPTEPLAMAMPAGVALATEPLGMAMPAGIAVATEPLGMAMLAGIAVAAEPLGMGMAMVPLAMRPLAWGTK